MAFSDFPARSLTLNVVGTNTDAVIINITKTSHPMRGVVASFKHETTVNVTDGIEAAVRKVLADAAVDPLGGEILSLTIGTTVPSSSLQNGRTLNPISALCQCRRSSRCAKVIEGRRRPTSCALHVRIPVCQFSLSRLFMSFVEPLQFVDFPPHLKSLMNGHTAIIKGGLQMWVIYYVATNC